MSKLKQLTIRLKLFYKLIVNELYFDYHPFVKMDVAAFVNPKFTDPDADAVHFVLVQETYKFLEQNGCKIMHVSSHEDYIQPSSFFAANMRKVAYFCKPFISKMPVIRWFICVLPIVAIKT
jgi:hypothetical protein